MGSSSPQKESLGYSSEGYATPWTGPSSPASGEGFGEVASMEDSFAVADDMNGYSDPRYEHDSTNWEADSDEDDIDESVGIDMADLTSSGVPVKKHRKKTVKGAIGKVANAGKKVAKAGAKAGVMGAKAGVKAGVGVTKAGIGVTKTGAKAGKKVVTTSLKVGKGTVSAGVSAGKAIMGSTSLSKKPPAREPKSKAVHSRKEMRKERDLHVAVDKAV